MGLALKGLKLVNILAYHHLPKQVKLKNSSATDYLLFCNRSVSYDDFDILIRKSKKFLLELKETLLIMRDNPSLNMKIASPPLDNSTGPSNKICVRILFTFNSCYVIRIEFNFLLFCHV